MAAEVPCHATHAHRTTARVRDACKRSAMLFGDTILSSICIGIRSDKQRACCSTAAVMLKVKL